MNKKVYELIAEQSNQKIIERKKGRIRKQVEKEREEEIKEGEYQEDISKYIRWLSYIHNLSINHWLTTDR